MIKARGESEKVKKKQKHFLNALIFLSLVILFLLNNKLNNGGWMIFQETFYMPSLQDETNPYEETNVKNSFYDGEQNENHHSHEGHDHNQKVKFVLRDSDLGAPEFIGGNDFKGEFINKNFDLAVNLKHIDLSSFAFADFSYNERNIAIGCAITTNKQQNLAEDILITEMPFFKSLLPSFCSTASKGFNYHFYIGHDHNDYYFSKKFSHSQFSKYFKNQISTKCFKTPNVTLHLVECQHSKHPAWAQNDVMMAAYMDNMDYYYRVNDDTVLRTTGWTIKFIDELLRYNPPNVGVVGPWFKAGNTAILTFDFVHRTHIDIFGCYYPRTFTDWFADEWITKVYQPAHVKKVAGTVVTHTMEKGQRYFSHLEKAKLLEVEIEVGRQILRRFIDKQMNKSSVFKKWNSKTSNVISMFLSGNDVGKIFGTLRYALLQPVIFPNWRLRVYVCVHSNTSKTIKIMVNKLQNFGVEVVNLAVSDSASSLHPSLWRYLVIDDPKVQRFIIRDSDTRPTQREFVVLRDWMASTPKALHCIRDHPLHSIQPLNPGLVGGFTRLILDSLNQPFKKFLHQAHNESFLLNNLLWPKFKNQVLCHDSLSCQKFPFSKKFPQLRFDNIYIGQKYDSNEKPIKPNPIQTQSIISKENFQKEDCVELSQAGFDIETVKHVLRNNFNFWSVDYHVTPLLDIKSLLQPIGVNLIDNSFSNACRLTDTCANLKVLNADTGMALSRRLIRKFYKTYKDDPVIKSVSAFICTLPVSLCRIYKPFHKPIMMWVTIRYELGLGTAEKWHRMNGFLKEIAQDKNSVLVANNLYDSKYIEYFTGLRVPVLPLSAVYLKQQLPQVFDPNVESSILAQSFIYNPTNPSFLLSPVHSDELFTKFFKEFNSLLTEKNLDLSIHPLRELYPHYDHAQLATHTAIIHIPYQVSMVSFTEQYRMNIPLFVPSIDLLTLWNLKYQVVRSRTLLGSEGQFGHKSLIKGVMKYIYDPNDELSEDAVRYWLEFSDFYQMPHIIYFDSVADMVDKMTSVDFEEVSRRMRKWNDEEEKKIKKHWSAILDALSARGGGSDGDDGVGGGNISHKIGNNDINKKADYGYINRTNIKNNDENNNYISSIENIYTENSQAKEKKSTSIPDSLKDNDEEFGGSSGADNNKKNKIIYTNNRNNIKDGKNFNFITIGKETSIIINDEIKNNYIMNDVDRNKDIINNNIKNYNFSNGNKNTVNNKNKNIIKENNKNNIIKNEFNENSNNSDQIDSSNFVNDFVRQKPPLNAKDSYDNNGLGNENKDSKNNDGYSDDNNNNNKYTNGNNSNNNNKYTNGNNNNNNKKSNDDEGDVTVHRLSLVEQTNDDDAHEANDDDNNNNNNNNNINENNSNKNNNNNSNENNSNDIYKNKMKQSIDNNNNNNIEDKSNLNKYNNNKNNSNNNKNNNNNIYNNKNNNRFSKIKNPKTLFINSISSKAKEENNGDIYDNTNRGSNNNKNYNENNTIGDNNNNNNNKIDNKKKKQNNNKNNNKNKKNDENNNINNNGNDNKNKKNNSNNINNNNNPNVYKDDDDGNKANSDYSTNILHEKFQEVHNNEGGEKSIIDDDNNHYR